MAPWLVHLDFTGLECADHHVQAQAHEQHKGNPVVPGLDVVGGDRTQGPTHHGRDGFDDAKDGAGAQGF
ncbi:hypothetical protein D3C85_1589290 [compost metagenome]